MISALVFLFLSPPQLNNISAMLCCLLFTDRDLALPNLIYSWGLFTEEQHFLTYSCSAHSFFLEVTAAQWNSICNSVLLHDLPQHGKSVLLS